MIKHTQIIPLILQVQLNVFKYISKLIFFAFKDL